MENTTFYTPTDVKVRLHFILFNFRFTPPRNTMMHYLKSLSQVMLKQGIHMVILLSIKDAQALRFS